mgnify:CR=1 FL=1
MRVAHQDAMMGFELPVRPQTTTVQAVRLVGEGKPLLALQRGGRRQVLVKKLCARKSLDAFYLERLGHKRTHACGDEDRTVPLGGLLPDEFRETARAQGRIRIAGLAGGGVEWGVGAGHQ